MTYFNAIKFIKEAPDTTPNGSSGAERLAKLCAALDNPQKKLKYIRLAGNNGKTVCARMVISILNEAGIKNGCLSMPIHAEIRENVRIDGEPITIYETIEYVSTIAAAVTKINHTAAASESAPFRPTSHEIMLCVALLAFSAHKCIVSIIESDHDSDDSSRFLPSPFAAVICGRIPSGDRQEIAKIRSYICRGIREIISAPQTPEAYKIISDTCFSASCRLTLPAPNKFSLKSLTLRGCSFVYKDKEYSLRLCGKFQTMNALIAIECAEMLARCGYKINYETTRSALAAVVAPCKFEILSVSPTIIADSTHTDIAIGAVCDSLADFKAITGNRIKLCLPRGELVDKYIEALTLRGYSIKKLSLWNDGDETELESVSGIPAKGSKTLKQTAKDALDGLENDEILLISGPSNFTIKLRYEILAILGFGFN